MAITVGNLLTDPAAQSFISLVDADDYLAPEQNTAWDLARNDQREAALEREHAAALARMQDAVASAKAASAETLPEVLDNGAMQQLMAERAQARAPGYRPPGEARRGWDSARAAAGAGAGAGGGALSVLSARGSDDGAASTTALSARALATVQPTASTVNRSLV